MKVAVAYTIVQLAVVTNTEFRLEDGIWKEFQVQTRAWLNRGEATSYEHVDSPEEVCPEQKKEAINEWKEAIASLNEWKKELAAIKAAKAKQQEQEPIFDEDGWDF